MKIAVVSTNTWPTPPVAYGGEVFVYNLSQGLCELGHQVTLYGAPGSKLPHEKCRCRLKYYLGGYGDIQLHREWTIADWYYDEIMAHDLILDFAHSHPIAEEAGWYHRADSIRVRVVLNGVTSVTPRCGPYNVIVGSQKWKDLSIYGRSQFYGTPYEQFYGSQIVPIPELDIAGVIPWAVDAKFYAPDPAQKPEDFLLWISRPTPYKGLGTALEVAAKTKSRLVVIPGIALAAHAEEWRGHQAAITAAREAGATVEVVHLPKDSRHHLLKRDWYRRAKALLYPVGCHEPFGLVVAEALACGTPVITTHMGAMPEIVTNGKTGIICDTNADELATAVEEIGRIDREEVRKDGLARFHYLLAAERYVALERWAEEGHGIH